MATVSMLEFRKNARAIILQALQGQRFVLTYRGRPVLRLEPIADEVVTEDDPFYGLTGLAGEVGEPLSNRDMDRIIYES